MLPALANVRIVLVHTSHPGNIGATARAMMNMGLGELVLVAPKRFPDPEATGRAASAASLLETARVVEDLDQALSGCTLVVGTSARERRIPWPLLEARSCARRMVAEAATSPVALLFGREDRGLTNEELMRCQLHVTIPTNPDYSSLNLAMAVQVLAYELRVAALGDDVADLMAGWDQPMATAADVERFLAHLETTLIAIGFLRPDVPKQLMTRLRRLFARTRLDSMEVSILRGILTAMDQSLARRDAP